jgi:hypothetical protein
MRALSPLPKPTMANETPALHAASATDLAEQLRDGPLQRLVELQAQTAAIADRLAKGTPARIEDVAELVRLSVAAMEHFQHFTRELGVVLRELTDGQHPRH